MNNITEVSPEEFDAICARMDARRDAVTEAKRAVTSARTLREKIDARQQLSAARQLPVTYPRP